MPQINTQSGNYTLQPQDSGTEIVFTSALPVVFTLRTPGSPDWMNAEYGAFSVSNVGTGTVTIVSAGATIDGEPSLILHQHDIVTLNCDGSNFFSNGGSGGNGGGTSIIENIGLVVDGGGSPITAGVKGFIAVPYSGTIQSVTMLADQAGSAVVDIWKTTYALYDPGTHPVVGDSITASDKPTLSSAYKNQDTTLTGWTTSVSAGDVLQFIVNSASSITRLVLTLAVQRSA